MVARGLSVRRMSKLINPEQPEVARRALNRYVNENQLPSEPYAEEIARVLDIPREEIPLGVARYMGDPFRNRARTDA